MRIPLDQGIGRSAAEALRKLGHDAVHVGELGLSTAEDHDLIALADREGRVVVTFDADFHAILAASGAPGPSVIRVRIEGLSGEAIARLLEPIFRELESDLRNGAAVSVLPDRIRVHKLPFDV
jgi:predicted nuclease of predicted toxin-antitoxin system